MIKNIHRRKLSRTGAHRKALLRNLATSLFQHEKVTTTLPKAKELASFSERLITLARPGGLNARRALGREIKDKVVFQKVMDVLVPRYQNRAGGYTQIFRLGTRVGDRAEMAMIKLVS
jgi:large subunit ribosomal protein L17